MYNMHLSTMIKKREKFIFPVHSAEKSKHFAGVHEKAKNKILSAICDLIQSLKRNTVWRQENSIAGISLICARCQLSLSSRSTHASFSFHIFPTKFPVSIFTRNKKRFHPTTAKKTTEKKKQNLRRRNHNICMKMTFSVIPFFSEARCSFVL